MRGLATRVPLAVLGAVLLAACHSSPKASPTPTSSPPVSPGVSGTATATALPATPAITVTATPNPSVTPTAAPTGSPVVPHSPAAPATPGATLQSAETYVQANNTIGGTLQFVDPGTTWVPGNTLHVLHATPEGAAGSGGDTFYFFVNGALVGQKMFTQSVQAAPVSSTEFSVSYQAYKPGDAACCPSGGQATARFQWNGTKLLSLDPMTGAVLS